MGTHISPRLIAAGAVGNALEFYDFVVFGYLAVHIGAAFFPAGDPVAGIIASSAPSPPAW